MVLKFFVVQSSSFAIMPYNSLNIFKLEVRFGPSVSSWTQKSLLPISQVSFDVKKTHILSFFLEPMSFEL